MDDPDDTAETKPSDFDRRLGAARLRQGPKPARGPERTFEWGAGAKAGLELVSAVTLSTAIGWALDRWLHTLPLFLIVFLLLGFGAGIASIWRLMGAASR